MAREKVISLLPRKNPRLPGWITHAFSFGTPVSVIKPEVTVINGEMTCTHEDVWNVRVPVDPALAIQILTRDLPPVEKIEMKLMPAPGHIEVKITAPDFQDERTFTLSTARTGYGNIKVSENVQQLGIGRKLMRNEIEFAHAVGLQKFMILAGSRAGGYAWNAMGAKPVNMNSTSFDEDTRKRVAQRFEALILLLSEQEKVRAAPLLVLQTPRQMQALADLDVDLSPRLKAAFSESAFFTADKRIGDALFSAFNDRAQAGRKITLGQALLAGTCWEGQIDLQDVAQMRRVGEYVGGWKYIGFA